MEEVALAAIVFIFSLFFYGSSLGKGCYYRRWVFPAMFFLFGIIYYNNFYFSGMFWIAAIFTYYGFKGYGREALKQQEKSKEEIQLNETKKEAITNEDSSKRDNQGPEPTS